MKHAPERGGSVLDLFVTQSQSFGVTMIVLNFVDRHVRGALSIAAIGR